MNPYRIGEPRPNRVVVIGLAEPPTRAEVTRRDVNPDWVPRASIVQAVHRAQQAQDHYAYARYGHLEAENHRLRVALSAVAGDCVNKPAPSCPTDPRLTADAIIRTDRWYTHCIAREALKDINEVAA